MNGMRELPSKDSEELWSDNIAHKIHVPLSIVRKLCDQLACIDHARLRHSWRIGRGKLGHAPKRERFRYVNIAPTPTKDTQEQVVVFIPGQALVEAADRFEGFARDQRCRRQNMHVVAETPNQTTLWLLDWQIVQI